MTNMTTKIAAALAEFNFYRAEDGSAYVQHEPMPNAEHAIDAETRIVLYDGARAPESFEELVRVIEHVDGQPLVTEGITLAQVVEALNGEHPLDHSSDFETLFLIIAHYLQNQPPARPRLGVRVTMSADVDRFPDFIAPKGSVGTIVLLEHPSASPGAIGVRMDKILKGAEEWKNVVNWLDESFFQDVVLGAPDVEAIATNALNAAALSIQETLGVEAGDLASMFFSGKEGETVERIFARYAEAEIKDRSAIAEAETMTAFPWGPAYMLGALKDKGENA